MSLEINGLDGRDSMEFSSAGVQFLSHSERGLAREGALSSIFIFFLLFPLLNFNACAALGAFFL